ncbi:Hypothetical protein AT6N2_L2013 [Agrobacterium tumefaciens]|nr:Hypothetical protein AT6N2_L2013 [Agrobacterium tumefaciens]
MFSFSYSRDDYETSSRLLWCPVKVITPLLDLAVENDPSAVVPPSPQGCNSTMAHLSASRCAEENPEAAHTGT